MPYTLRKEGGKWVVRSPHGTKGRHKSKKKAQRQLNLLRAVKHGWKPTGG